MFRRMQRLSACPRLVLALIAPVLVASSARAEKQLPDLDLRARFGFGHDSNSFREAVAVDPGYFMPYELHARYEKHVDDASRLQFRAAAGGAQYLSTVSDGGEMDLDLGIDCGRRLLGVERSQAPSLDLEVRGDFGVNRRTYISRVAGEEYSIDVQGVPVSLADRFHSRDLGAGANLTLRCPWSTQWSADLDVRHRDYDNDYDGIPGVDRLDNRRTEASFQVTQRIGRPVRVSGEYLYGVTDYYDRAVRDLTGSRVEGVAQTFRFNSVRGELRGELGRRGRLSLQSAWEGRHDPYLGYYDSALWSLGPEIRVQATSKLELRAEYAYEHRTYDRAHVNFDPAQALRDDHENHVLLEGTYQLEPRSSVFVLVAYDNVDEMNPVYTYDRARTAVGYELRY